MRYITSAINPNKILCRTIRLENMKEDLKKLGKEIGFIFNCDIKTNISSSHKNKSWESFYHNKPHLVDKVYELYKEDFKGLGYSKYYKEGDKITTELDTSYIKLEKYTKNINLIKKVYLKIYYLVHVFFIIIRIIVRFNFYVISKFIPLKF